MNLLSLFKRKRTSDRMVIPLNPDGSFPEFEVAFLDTHKGIVPHYRIAGSNDSWKILPGNGRIYYDPIECCPGFDKISEKVDDLANEKLGDANDKFGSCHAFWSIKKKILLEEYGIHWHSLSDLNPMCHFD